MNSGVQKNIRRDHISILLVFPDPNVINQLKQVLTRAGFTSITTAPSHLAGIAKIKQRNFTLALFDSKPTDQNAKDFVSHTLNWDKKCVLIPVSAQPQIDDIFGLLKLGAMSFIVHPFTSDSVEQAILKALEGPTFSELVLEAPDRNAALTALVLNNLYRLAVAKRQAREFASAASEIPRCRANFIESVELAKLFCEGGIQQLKDKLVDNCISHSEIPASRLGRMRMKLKKQRDQAAAAPN